MTDTQRDKEEMICFADTLKGNRHWLCETYIHVRWISHCSTSEISHIIDDILSIFEEVSHVVVDYV